MGGHQFIDKQFRLSKHVLETDEKRTCGVEESKNLAVGLCGDGSLSLQVVRLDAIARSDSVLAQDQAEALLLRQVKHLLRLAFDEQGAQLVTWKWALV